MADVNVTLNGRTYRLECDDGEEDHLIELSEMVRDRHDRLQKKFGQVGDDRLLLMTALMVADELTEMEKKIDEVEAAQASSDERVKSAEAQVAGDIAAVADRIEILNAALGEEETQLAKG
ncbi:MAG: cell division protein ZapA [Hyphomicrobiaceae bacterium]|nr:cell division protein ZapA [Hyphomicrobiaceae bacterium]